MSSRPVTRTLFFLLVVLTFCRAQNLVVNGAFAEGSRGWDSLLVAGSAQATKIITNGEYRISITAAGSEPWNVQLKQPGITLDSGAFYQFSFDAWASAERNIEASVGMENGPYTLYTPANKASFDLGTERQRFIVRFRMGYTTDPNARVQFNCGMAVGTVYLTAVTLEKITTPMLSLLSPVGGEAWSSTTVRTIEWLGIGVENIALFYSLDAGLTWTTINTGLPSSGTYQWRVPAATSPWCLVRVADAAGGPLMDTSKAPFEIGPFFNLVQNGNFSDTTPAPWNPLGVYGSAAATGGINNGTYTMVITAPGSEPWNVQFSQSGITLTQGETYVFSFSAWADGGRSLQAHIGQAGGAYESYFDDTSKGTIVLSTDPGNYSIEFTMLKPTDTNTRIDFNTGTAAGTVFIDNVSLYRKRVMGISPRPRGWSHLRANRPVFPINGRWLLSSETAPVRALILDCRGKVVSTLVSSTGKIWWDGRSAAGRRCAPGIYVAQVVSWCDRQVHTVMVPSR